MIISNFLQFPPRYVINQLLMNYLFWLDRLLDMKDLTEVKEIIFSCCIKEKFNKTTVTKYMFMNQNPQKLGKLCVPKLAYVE